jgi:hypothetical protein
MVSRPLLDGANERPDAATTPSPTGERRTRESANRNDGIGTGERRVRKARIRALVVASAASRRLSNADIEACGTR